jgi:hypothetical protein
MVAQSPVVLKAKEAWRNASTKWGKTAVITFYMFVGLAFVVALTKVYDPLNMNFACIVDGASEKSKAWIVCFARLFFLAAAFLMYYVGEIGVNVPNLCWMICFFAICFLYIGAVNVNNGCDDPFFVKVLYFAGYFGLPVIALFGLYMDKRSTRGSVEESQPLVA